MRAARLAAAALGALLLSCCGTLPPSSPAPAPQTSVPGAASQPPPASNPAGSTARTVDFAAAGDFGDGETAAKVLDAMASSTSQFGLALGDLSYGSRGTESAWCSFVTDHLGPDLPLQLLSGNHESDGRNGSIDAFADCLPPRLPGVKGDYGRQWFVDIPQQHPVLRLIMISPGLRFAESGRWDYVPGNEHYNWTASAIDSARDADIPWVVVATHLPCLTMGRYGCDPGSAVTNLLLDKKVDLVLNGHEHLYQRTQQLALGPGCPSLVPAKSSSACIADTDGNFQSGAGTVFATVGTGGRPLRDVNTKDAEAPYFAAYSGRNADPTHGFLQIRATDNALSAEFVRAGGGDFADSFTLRRR
ncbi:phosphohydrolase [Arthrobacter sp. CAU 1506]|uniref:metallophosphoesterase n=1 Tax=Arthrobacter sp. CAU 1506 TaxID=2560052 RepID=UPI0010AC01ED|nr:metallophosphoesterase [Arthrobacter sp. CAU 1506]TJY72295.1 phosphohydrolase [Arthrobacter sp. CAU 1506]